MPIQAAANKLKHEIETYGCPPLFPGADSFSLSPAGRDSFLRSLLTVNHIGFHLYEYLR